MIEILASRLFFLDFGIFSYFLDSTASLLVLNFSWSLQTFKRAIKLNML